MRKIINSMARCMIVHCDEGAGGAADDQQKQVH